MAVDFDLPVDIAAKNFIGTITADMEHRLSNMFEKTETPECRAKIAEHFGYFTESFALERPLPFSEVPDFENTCEDEIVWDFNNLPEGVVSIS